jgi:hypothetical protein
MAVGFLSHVDLRSGTLFRPRPPFLSGGAFFVRRVSNLGQTAELGGYMVKTQFASLRALLK